jgi:hypothetical protein
MKTRTPLIRLALATMTLAALFSSISSIQAAKPPGGGGSTAPAGTIYYFSPPWGGDGMDYSMKADGTQKTALGISGTVYPSGLMHGGKRWFLQYREVPGEHIVPGFVRWELFAVREDGTGAVQLTDDAAMMSGLRWTPAENGSEAVIAGSGERWNADGTRDVASLGIYSATLRFDVDGNVIGLDSAPTFLVSVGVVPDSYNDGSPVSDLFYPVSFSPDMTKLVADHYEGGIGLRIIDIATGVEKPLVSGWANAPAWSPSGTAIAFRVPVYPERIDVVSPNGTGRASVFKAKPSYAHYLYDPTWSPDSAYLAFEYYTENTWPPTVDIYRVAAKGGGAVNLTPDIASRAFLMGWR